MLLRLEATRVDVDQPREFRQPNNTIHRHIGDVRLAIERHHVVFAVRIEADVAHQHKIVVTAGLAECTVEHLHRALAVALIDFLVGANHALGRLQQTLTIWIIARIGDERTHGGFRLLARGPRLNRRRRRSHVLRQALLRPRLHIGVLRVHDGSLRSTGTQRYRVCHRVGRVSYRSGPLTGPLRAPGRCIPIRQAILSLPSAENPSRAAVPAPIYSFGWQRQTASLGLSEKRQCLTRFITQKFWNWRAISPAWAGCLRPMPRPPRIRSYAA